MKKIKLSREQNIPEIHHTKFKKGEKKKIHNIAEKKRKESYFSHRQKFNLIARVPSWNWQETSQFY